MYVLVKSCLFIKKMILDKEFTFKDLYMSEFSRSRTKRMWFVLQFEPKGSLVPKFPFVCLCVGGGLDQTLLN